MRPPGRAAATGLAGLAGLLALALLAGCTGSGSSPTPPRPSATTASPAGSASPTSGAATALPAGRPTPAVGKSARTFVNPVVRQDFPDPGILRVGGLYYAYSTNSSTGNVPVRSSPDLVTWTDRGDAMPDLDDRWAGSDDTWAPEVIQVGARFVLFYTAPAVATGTQCIGRAVSTSPLGPFTDDSVDALVCQNEKGGSIDPSPFRDRDGDLYLLWKNDGNCCGYEVDLWSQRLSADGLSLVGEPSVLLTRSRAWQGKVIEGPELVRHGSAYWLFFAGGDYASAGYAEGVARCAGPSGPCHDQARPVLTSTAQARGPGHAFVVTTPSGQTWLAFHAWAKGHIGDEHPGRELWLTRVRWAASGPVVDRPSTARQVAPR